VFAEPRRSADRYFTVLARDNGLLHARLGLAVGKKHVRRAVGRNRIKRLVRESFRVHAGDLGGVDLVVLSRANATVENGVLSRSLRTHWQRLGLGAAG
jgi:ribonuclease P protein component